MDISIYLKFMLALVFVLALIGLLAWLARRFGFGVRTAPASGKGRRLSIVEVTPVDAKRRLVLVRRDTTEHLLLLGATGERVIETGIPAAIDAIPGKAVSGDEA